MRTERTQDIERILLWAIRIGAVALLFTPLIITPGLFFPYITGKNFFFRIVVEFMFGSWAALAIIAPQFRPKKSPVLITLGIFMSILVLATIFGADPYHSFWSNFERMEGLVTYLHMFALFIILSHSLRNKKEWFLLLCLSIGVSVMVALYGGCEHFLSQEGAVAGSLASFCTTGSGGVRPFATFGNPIYLAVYLMFHLFFLIMLTYNAKDILLRMLLAVVFLFEGYVFFIAESRGVFLGLVSGIFVAALLSLVLLRTRVYKFFAMGILLFVILLVGSIIVFPKSTFVKNNPVFSRFGSFSLERVAREPRVMIWGIGLRALQERPLLGWGPENFIIPYGKYYNANLFGNEPWFDRTHNMFIEWLVAAGITGFLSYLSIFGATIFILWKLYSKKLLDPFFFFFGAGLIVAYLVQDAFVFDTITTYLFLIFSLAFVHSLTSGTSDTKARRRVIVPVSSMMYVAAVVVATVLTIYAVNTKQVLAANQLINALQSLGEKKNVEEIVSEFDKVFSYNTFGSTEARERLADIIVQYTGRNSKLTQPFMVLLNKGITELELEQERQPLTAKYPLFLGKLYTIKVNVTGEGMEKAEIAYKKAIELAPQYEQAHLGLAEFYLITNNKEKANDRGDIILQLPTDSEVVGRLLPQVLSIKLLTGSYRTADKTLTEFISRNPQKAASDLFGITDVQLLVQRSLTSSADLEGRILFLSGLKKYYDNLSIPVNEHIMPTILVGLAQTYTETGDRQKALEAAKKALSLEESLPTKNDNLIGQINKFIASIGITN